MHECYILSFHSQIISRILKDGAKNIEDRTDTKEFRSAIYDCRYTATD